MSNGLLERDWFWTANGKPVGYRKEDALFSCGGQQIGEFQDDDVYGALGSYIGEISADGRLITKLQKLGWRRAGFAPGSAEIVDPPQDIDPQHVTHGFRNFKISGREV